MRVLNIILISFLCLLTACGGGSDTPKPPPPVVQTAEGNFIDSVVEGLEYSSGEQSGITSDSGTFIYELATNGDPADVTFTVGAITLGTVTGNAIITPVDLTGSDTSLANTQNIVRFLLMLDFDGDSSNGITISSEVREIAANWVQVDFTSSDFEADLASIISDVSVVDSRTPILPTTLVAQDHLEGTLSCLSSGVFKGSFSGGDNGTFLLWIQHQRFDPFAFGDNTPRVGVTSALVFSTDENLVSGVAPQRGLSFDSDKQFISGVVSTGAEFSGDLENYQSITNGVWNNGLSNESGTFIGERVGGDENANHRLAGFFNLQGFPFSADGSGLLALDIMADNSVTGIMVTLRGDETTLSGSLTANVITVSGGGNELELAFDADGTDSSNDLALGTTSGFIGTMSGASGTSDVIGTSCQPD